MLFGSKKYLYAAVVFLNGRKFFMYRTDDRSLKTNDVVMVPVTGQESQPAIIAWVREFAADNVPYPLEKTKMILGRADQETAKLFVGIDHRMPLDISLKSVRDQNGNVVKVVTTAAEREKLRRRYADDPETRIIETMPLPED